MRWLTRHRLLTTGLIAAGLAAGTLTASAAPDTRHRPAATWIGITGATNDCSDWVEVTYNIQDLNGAAWTVHPDDGTPVEASVLFIGNGAPRGGHWGALPSFPGGEGVIRVDMRGIPTHEPFLRITRAGITSTAFPITGCADPS